MVDGRRLNRTEYWKNFRLAEELDVSGTFIYNGIRRFHEIKMLDRSADIFEVFYQLSIGIERLMKISIVLLEHDDQSDPETFEKLLRTHNLQTLLNRIEQRKGLGLFGHHSSFLNILTQFYKDLRYDRFSLNSTLELGKERQELLDFLKKQLNVEFHSKDALFGNENTSQFKKFIRKIVIEIASTLFELIRDTASALGLYTYELYSGSKAETVFLRKANLTSEDHLWKELLIFFMNTKETSGYLEFLRGIEPLPFDPGLVGDYLSSFQSDSARFEVLDELEAHYEEVPDIKDRRQMMGIIGQAGVYFSDDPDSDLEEDE
ncbi:MAG: hypothetical protein ACOYK9_06920 [Chlamydiia bacterium]